jgi:hypothetical protein
MGKGVGKGGKDKVIITLIFSNCSLLVLLFHPIRLKVASTTVLI